VTAGNASGVNDGAAALISPRGRVRAPWPDAARPHRRLAAAGVAPRIMGIGPVPATQKLLARLGLTIADFDVIELNEAFAAQGLAVLRALGLPTTANTSTPTAARSRSAIRWA
jgi:acetyl-CoA acetyltransferase